MSGRIGAPDISVSINLEANTALTVTAERGAGRLYVLVQQHGVLHHAYTIMCGLVREDRDDALSSTRHAVSMRSTLILHARYERLGHWYDVPLKSSQRLALNSNRYDFASAPDQKSPYNLALLVNTSPQSRPELWSAAE